MNSCVKIANTDFNKVYIPNVNGWDITIQNLSNIEEAVNSDEISSVSLNGEISISKAKDLNFNYVNIDTTDVEKLIKNRIQYISLNTNDNDNDMEFDIDF